MTVDIWLAIGLFFGGQIFTAVAGYFTMKLTFSVQIKELQVRVHKLEGFQQVVGQTMKDMYKEMVEIRIALEKIRP